MKPETQTKLNEMKRVQRAEMDAAQLAAMQLRCRHFVNIELLILKDLFEDESISEEEFLKKRSSLYANISYDIEYLNQWHKRLTKNQFGETNEA